MRNSKIIKILSIVLIFLMVVSNSVLAVDNVKKDETVYVTLTSDGKAKEKIVSVHLHVDEVKGKLEDKSILKNIENIKGEEKPIKNGEKLTWETNKNDLFYQGNTDKELPVEVNISYYLDEEEIKPEDLAGKSGNIRIVIDLENKLKHRKYINGSEKEIYTPFVGGVVLNLPMDKFKNVKVNSGKVVTDGNNQVVTLGTLPGIKESLDSDMFDIKETFEIKSEVEDFEMGPIMITLTPSIPEIGELDKVEDITGLIGGVKKLKDASSKLADATTKLKEGQISLAENIVKIKNGAAKLGTSAKELKKGILDIDNGIEKAYNGSKKVSDGAKMLSESAGKLGQGAMEFGNGALNFSQKSQEFSKGSVKVSKGVDTIANKTGDLSTGAKDLAKGTEELVKGHEELNKGVLKALGGLEKLKQGKEKEIEVIDLLLKGVDKLLDGSKKLQKNPATKSVGDTLVKGLTKQKEGLEGLKTSGNEFMTGLKELEEGIKSIEAGSNKLTKEMKNLNKGQQKLADGLNKLDKGTNSLKPAAKKLAEGSKGLTEGANKLAKSAESLNEGANKFVKGSNDLIKGSQDVTDGLYKLNGGTDKLAKGADKFVKGSNDLASGAVELSEGASRLAEGSKELDANMNRFNNEGIGEMVRKLSGNTEDVESLLEVKDELVKLSNEYGTFTGKINNMDTTVKFIMKTEEIKKPEIEKEIEVNKEEDDGGFFSWIKDKITGLF